MGFEVWVGKLHLTCGGLHKSEWLRIELGWGWTMDGGTERILVELCLWPPRGSWFPMLTLEWGDRYFRIPPRKED